jgi:hypothetical protein
MNASISIFSLSWLTHGIKEWRRLAAKLNIAITGKNKWYRREDNDSRRNARKVIQLSDEILPHPVSCIPYEFVTPFFLLGESGTPLQLLRWQPE